MRYAAAFGLTALLPATLNYNASARAASIPALLCHGSESPGTATVPLAPNAPPPETICCAKGCHGGNPRKRLGQHI